MLHLVCLACGPPLNTKMQDDRVSREGVCPVCGGKMMFADPSAVATFIVHSSVVSRPQVRIWRIVRQDFLIGLVWGVGLAVLIASPLSLEPAFRDERGIVGNYPPEILKDAGVKRMYRPGASAISWSEWCLLFVTQCGPVVAIASGVGAIEGVGKVASRRAW